MSRIPLIIILPSGDLDYLKITFTASSDAPTYTFLLSSAHILAAPILHDLCSFATATNKSLSPAPGTIKATFILLHLLHGDPDRLILPSSDGNRVITSTGGAAKLFENCPLRGPSLDLVLNVCILAQQWGCLDVVRKLAQDEWYPSGPAAKVTREVIGVMEEDAERWMVVAILLKNEKMFQSFFWYFVQHSWRRGKNGEEEEEELVFRSGGSRFEMISEELKGILEENAQKLSQKIFLKIFHYSRTKTINLAKGEYCCPSSDMERKKCRNRQKEFLDDENALRALSSGNWPFEMAEDGKRTYNRRGKLLSDCSLWDLVYRLEKWVAVWEERMQHPRCNPLGGSLAIDVEDILSEFARVHVPNFCFKDFEGMSVVTLSKLYGLEDGKTVEGEMKVEEVKKQEEVRPEEKKVEKAMKKKDWKWHVAATVGKRKRYDRLAEEAGGEDGEDDRGEKRLKMTQERLEALSIM